MPLGIYCADVEIVFNDETSARRVIFASGFICRRLVS